MKITIYAFIDSQIIGQVAGNESLYPSLIVRVDLLKNSLEFAAFNKNKKTKISGRSKP